MHNPTSRTYSSLAQAYDFFKAELFGVSNDVVN